MATLLGTEVDDVLTGGSAPDLLKGEGGNDTLVGMGAADTLDGGSGTDSLAGGFGNDTYYVDVTYGFDATSGTNRWLMDALDESVDGGNDTLVMRFGPDASYFSVLDLAALPNFENVTLLNPAAYYFGLQLLQGTDVANRLVGNGYNNAFWGLGGDDTILGGGGQDQISADDGNDSLEGGDGNDQLWGGNGGDTLLGGSGDDNLYGQEGLDFLDGGSGNDTLYGGNYSSSGESSPSADTLTGGAGNDVYIIGDSLDVVTAEAVGGGTDTITVTDRGWTLAAEFENLNVMATGSGSAVDAIGNELDNVIAAYGNIGLVSGGAGNDDLSASVDAFITTLSGGTGNDTFNVGSEDIVVELAGGGIDSLNGQMSGDVVLADTLEHFRFTAADGRNLTGNASANDLTGSISANLISGLDGDDSLHGGGGDDTLLGGNGNDYLDGTGGSSIDWPNVDVLDGGAGNDTYVVDGNDIITGETPDSGFDTLWVWGTSEWVLDPNFEQVMLLNQYSTITGNALANTLYAGGGSSTLRGLDGNDRLATWGWMDEYWQTSPFSDSSRLVGGKGDDTYYAFEADDIVELAGEGVDTVHLLATISHDHTVSLAANVENLYLDFDAYYSAAASNVDVIGNALDNLIVGSSALNSIEGRDGNDTLVGGRGADTLVGGTGNDRYEVESVADVIVEYDGEGTDSVVSGISWILPTGTESLVLTGRASINGRGNLDPNSISGNAARNILDGDEGADTLAGGLSSDTYYVDDSGDAVIEAAGEGTSDRIFSTVSLTVAANVELLRLTGFEDIDGRGDASDNYIRGNAGANQLDGYAGNDTLNGDSGNDTLSGGTQNDVLRGGAGSDLLSGGAGNDTISGDAGSDSFLFDKAPSTTGNVDHLTDFTPGSEKLLLDNAVFLLVGTEGSLDPTSFLMGTTALDANDRVLYDITTGTLFYDPDGTGAAARAQFAVLDNKAAITAADFQIV